MLNPRNCGLPHGTFHLLLRLLRVREELPTLRMLEPLPHEGERVLGAASGELLLLCQRIVVEQSARRKLLKHFRLVGDHVRDSLLDGHLGRAPAPLQHHHDSCLDPGEGYGDAAGQRHFKGGGPAASLRISGHRSRNAQGDREDGIDGNVHLDADAKGDRGLHKRRLGGIQHRLVELFLVVGELLLQSARTLHVLWDVVIHLKAWLVSFTIGLKQLTLLLRASGGKV
mmetsp:Transcript_19684/g.57150  ORF Transcript_19684/g.57150 Transcript_19684/m.57150 type:complete len:227 (+) Transcript_19684:297-977(+)